MTEAASPWMRPMGHIHGDDMLFAKFQDDDADRMGHIHGDDCLS
jgi:hypothetical protein